MREARRAWRWRIAHAFGSILVIGLLMLGSVGSKGVPLGIGQRSVMAQADQTLAGTQFTLPVGIGGPATSTSAPPTPSAAQVAAREAYLQRSAAMWAARS